MHFCRLASQPAHNSTVTVGYFPMSTSHDFTPFSFFTSLPLPCYHCQCKEQGGLRLRLGCQWLQTLLYHLSVPPSRQIVTSCESLLKVLSWANTCTQANFPLSQTGPRYEANIDSSRNRLAAVWVARNVSCFLWLCSLWLCQCPLIASRCMSYVASLIDSCIQRFS